MDDTLMAASVLGAILAGIGVVLLVVRHGPRPSIGPTSVTGTGELDVTVVACGLRGFASYGEAVPSKAVTDLLAEYHHAVGKVVAEVGGTASTCGGDGILVLLGAPLSPDDHACAGLLLGRRIHEVAGPVVERWSTGPHPLGVGVGVATGRVSVAANGFEAGTERSAADVLMDRAARLCTTAAAGETLVDARRAEGIVLPEVVRHDPVAIEGLPGRRRRSPPQQRELVHTGGDTRTFLDNPSALGSRQRTPMDCTGPARTAVT